MIVTRHVPFLTMKNGDGFRAIRILSHAIRGQHASAAGFDDHRVMLFSMIEGNGRRSSSSNSRRRLPKPLASALLANALGPENLLP
jgi:hypothetical protein